MTRLPVLWLAAAIVACAAPPSARATESPYVGPTSSQSPLVTTTPEPTPARTPDVVAIPAIARNDLTAHIRVLRRGWRPPGRTLVVAAAEDARITLIAIPIAPGGDPVPFLELTETSGWQLRRDRLANGATTRPRDVQWVLCRDTVWRAPSLGRPNRGDDAAHRLRRPALGFRGYRGLGPDRHADSGGGQGSR